MRLSHYWLDSILQQLVAICVLLVASNLIAAPADDIHQDNSDSAEIAFRSGDFAQASKILQRDLARSNRQAPTRERVILLVRLGQAQRSLGRYPSAVKCLTEANNLAREVDDDALKSVALEALAAVRAEMGELDEARNLLSQALASSQAARDPRRAVSIALEIASVSAAQGRHNAAGMLYQQLADDAAELDLPLLRARALAAAAASASHLHQHQRALDFAATCLDVATSLTDDFNKGSLLMSVGRTYQELHSSAAPLDKAKFLLAAHEAYQSALGVAQRLDDPRTASYGLAYLAQLYEREGRTQEALQLTRRAIFEAQRAEAPESLYRWQWQLARLLAHDGPLGPALLAYGRAIETLQTIRQDVTLTYASREPDRSFRDSVGPLYYEYADLQLQQASRSQDSSQRNHWLREACGTIEIFKSAEIDDYFQERCTRIAGAKQKRIDLDQLAPDAAVIYFIVLADRLEVVVNLPSGLKHVPVPVAEGRFSAIASQFRRAVEDRSTYDYMESGQILYDWLIRPIEPDLKQQQVKTLVFVPDGVLRTVPMAALFDGSEHLISRYAVAITPGLNLLEPRPIERRSLRLLSGGLSQPRGKFAALRHVPRELDEIQRLFGGQKLLNEQFIIPRLEQEFTGEEYSVVHIASHGQFSGEAHKTFMLTYDSRLSLDQLERLIQPSKFRGQPVELLTLSACQTAAGDDRAALGLAGIAIKAGARSAMATLWSVNDAASSQLVADFYGALHRERSLSKAKALQDAQLRMLNDQRYRHPCYWAGYLIIGNWL